MADIKSPEARSKNMAAIKNRNTEPEVFFRRKLFSIGLRYRINSKKVIGHPDLWLKKYNTAVFIHGCFWHRHNGCKYSTTPETRKDFWLQKFGNNIRRDKYVKEELKRRGIKTLIVWECTVKKMKETPSVENSVLNKIYGFINSEDLYLEL
ncbi:MAG: DNA mismatch endonuclease Vsr [Synergistes sp.]|nr:DNA mismatch endonuclease Vsr [Synergistes sp.]